MRIPSLDAELALIHRSRLERRGPDEASVHNLEKHLTAAAAIRTRGLYKSIIHFSHSPTLTL
jgi:hypothetical protein